MRSPRSGITVSQVFTPKSHEVNADMYIKRPLHETDLRRAIEGCKHTVVTGASGAGKSWLFKKVARDQKWILKVANCANATPKTANSMYDLIADTLLPAGHLTQSSYEQSMSAEAKIIGFGGGANTKRTYTATRKHRLEEAFEFARSMAGNSKEIVIAMDNLETIFNDSVLMKELGNIILLLDDERFAKFRIKLLLVGVPEDIREYYHKQDNLESISNRLTEIPCLRALSAAQVLEFARKGFKEQLMLSVSSEQLQKWANHIHEITLGLAQRVCEYCEYLAYAIEDNDWNPSDSLLEVADKKFFFSALHKSYAVVEGCMNERNGTTNRRDQVLYAVGRITAPEFEASEVVNRLILEFPKGTKGVKLNINKILGELCSRGLLKKVSKTKCYCFSDPKSLMVLRLMLKKENERVYKMRFSR